MPVGHHDSEINDIQWRICFPGQQHLVLDLTDVQILCYASTCRSEYNPQYPLFYYTNFLHCRLCELVRLYPSFDMNLRMSGNQVDKKLSMI
jgi:hypothetical protein